MNLNKVFILGRLTSDPQLKTIPSGQSVATFSVATNRVRLDKAGARQEETEYHNIVVWGRQAEVAGQFLTRGGLVLIEGRIQTRSWTDKTGSTRKTTEIICERLQLGPRSAFSAGGAGGGAQQKQSWGGSKQSGFGPSNVGSPEAKSDSSLTQEIKEEEIPIIDVDDEADIRAEDLPF